jgi:hypothetical protein
VPTEAGGSCAVVILYTYGSCHVHIKPATHGVYQTTLSQTGMEAQKWPCNDKFMYLGSNIAIIPDLYDGSFLAITLQKLEAGMWPLYQSSYQRAMEASVVLVNYGCHYSSQVRRRHLPMMLIGYEGCYMNIIATRPARYVGYCVLMNPTRCGDSYVAIIPARYIWSFKNCHVTRQLWELPCSRHTS